MPSPLQQALFERLHSKFGSSPRWEQLTRGRDFDAMPPHKAFHYLQMLLWNLARKAIPSHCSCVTSARGTMHAPNNEHPLPAGARDHASV
jgi:hypothetical protein